MKLKLTRTVALCFLAGLTLSTGALASGAHAGGHEHGHGEDEVGKPDIVSNANRTVTIDMSDAMRFTPSKLDVKQGETIRLIVKNSGQVKHEFVLGSEKELKEHYELMKKFPNMEHDEPNMLTVAPGQTGEVVWQFTKAGKIDFACLQPGHYDAGMKGFVNVARAKNPNEETSHGAHKH